MPFIPSLRSAAAAGLAFAAAVGLGLFGAAVVHAVAAPASLPAQFVEDDAHAYVQRYAANRHAAEAARIGRGTPLVDTAVRLPDTGLSARGPVALPSGSRFEIEVCADRAGDAVVEAIGPTGTFAPVWSGRVRGGQVQRTPPLRLEGVRGTETVRVVFRADGADGVVVRQLQILHV